MVFFAQFAAVATFSMLSYLVLRNYLLKGALTDHKFALISVGWFSLALLGVFFVSFLVLGIEIDPLLMRLGIGIASVNVLFGYPMACYGHKHVLASWLRGFLHPPEEDSNR